MHVSVLRSAIADHLQSVGRPNKPFFFGESHCQIMCFYVLNWYHFFVFTEMSPAVFLIVLETLACMMQVLFFLCNCLSSCLGLSESNYCVIVSKENHQHPLSFPVEASQSLLQYQQSGQQLLTLAGTFVLKKKDSGCREAETHI